MSLTVEELAVFGLASKVERAYRNLRNGNPWPFVELQWGRVIRADEVLADRTLPQQFERCIVLDDFQIDMIQSMADNTIREVFVKGNTGCGKGAAMAIAVCCFMAAWRDAKCVITRDSYRPAINQTFAEVVKWWRRMDFPPEWLTCQTQAIVNPSEPSNALRVASPKSDEGFSGAHSPHVLFVFDEASAAILNARFRLANTQATKFLALANPRTTKGEFRRAFRLADDPDKNQTVVGPMGRRRLITVDGADMINVRARCLDTRVAPVEGIEIAGQRFEPGQIIEPEFYLHVRPIVPGQTCWDTYLGLCADPDPDFVAPMAHGRFPDEDRSLQVVRGSDIVWHQRWSDRFHAIWKRTAGRASEKVLRKRLDKWCPIEAFGLDCGASKMGDPSVLTMGGKRGIREQRAIRTQDASELANWVVRAAESVGIDLRHSSLPVCVDTDGIGWGVVSLLRERGVRVIEFKGNGTSDVDPKRYANKRAEAYGEFGARISTEGQYKDQPFLIPSHTVLAEELRAPEKIFARDGLQFHITPKRKVPGVDMRVETITEKLGRSPDHGDSAVLFHRALQAVGPSLADWLDRGYF